MSSAEKMVRSTIDRHELIERMMGNIQVAQKMVERFLQGCETEMDQMESLIRIGDRAEIASLAHRHKGTAKTLAAPRVADLAAKIGTLSSEGSISDLLDCVEALRLAHDELRQCLEDWRTELGDNGAVSSGKGTDK